MKRRTLTLMICLLSVLSLVSVGFASWIITANDTQEAEGNIEIETVTDKRVFIVESTTGAGIKASNNIVFGAPETMSNADAWLTADGTKKEALTATIKFKVVDANDAVVAADKVTVTANIALVGGKTFADLVTAEYIEAAPTVTPVRDGDGVYTITVTLNWGSLWGNDNPYDYYNAHDVDAEITSGVTYGDHAAENIAAFAELNTLTYKVTITATAN